MNIQNSIPVFLRISISIGFLSAVADRFGLWPQAQAAWGDWESFVTYTAMLNPWFPNIFIPFVAGGVTFLEVIFAMALLLGFKTPHFARSSGVLLLIFGLAMSLTSGPKAPLDYSVFTAAAAAFALSIIPSRYMTLDAFLDSKA